jgi:DNA-binding NarL/FixJ family response regulator
MKKPRIVLAEDHALVSQGIVAMLNRRYEVVATIADGSEVTDAVAQHQPDIVLLDLSLPNRNGIDLLPELRARCPDVPVLVVSMHVDSHLVEVALKLGAAGFVPKNARLDELRTAITEVLAGRRYISPTLPRRSTRGAVAEPIGYSRLTARQRRIMSMIAGGMSSEEIAAELGVTTWAVHYHRKNIRRALGIQSDLEMYRYAILAGSDAGSSSGD